MRDVVNQLLESGLTDSQSITRALSARAELDDLREIAGIDLEKQTRRYGIRPTGVAYSYALAERALLDRYGYSDEEVLTAVLDRVWEAV